MDESSCEPLDGHDSTASVGTATEHNTGRGKGSVEADSFANLPESPMKAMAKLGGWKILRSMRTAIWLLLALIAATMIPVFVPQRIAEANKVAQIAAGNSTWYQVAERLQLFDVFGSPWFATIYISLFVVLTLCIVPRTLKFVRTFKRATATPTRAEMPRLANTASWETAVDVDTATVRARRQLRRSLYRVGKPSATGQFVAEKGVLRELGSLAFHWSFYLILAAMFVSRAFGFTGFAVLVEGESMVEAPIRIDQYDPGWFGDASHRGFEVILDDFNVEFRDDTGAAADFVSSIRVIDDGEQVIEKDVRVNDPLDYRGVKFFQSSFGWAARVVVRDSTAEVVFDDFVILSRDGPRNTWSGVVKVPGVEPQAGFRLFFFPTALVIEPEDAQTFGDELGPGVRLVARSGPPTADSPLLLFTEYRGDLGLNTGIPQNVAGLDTTRLGDPIDLGFAELGTGANAFADGLEVSFPELRHYSVFRVKRDPGLWLALFAAIFLTVGLALSLYVSRRRLWVSVQPAADSSSPSQTIVTVGGIAYQRKDSFPHEFAKLAAKLRGQIPELERIPQEVS